MKKAKRQKERRRYTKKERHSYTKIDREKKNGKRQMDRKTDICKPRERTDNEKERDREIQTKIERDGKIQRNRKTGRERNINYLTSGQLNQQL